MKVKHIITGTKTIDVKGYSQATIKGSLPYTVFALNSKGEIHDILAPKNVSDLRSKFNINEGIKKLKIVTAKESVWSLEERTIVKQIECRDPKSVTIEDEKPLSIDDRIKMAIKQGVSEAASLKDMETFEEANDFSFNEDDHFTKGEMQEMGEEDLDQVIDTAREIKQNRAAQEAAKNQEKLPLEEPPAEPPEAE